MRLLERPADVYEMEPMPADGDAPCTNPPAFRWLVQDDVVQWRLQLSGPSGACMTFGPLNEAVFAPDRRLAVGRWSWQVIGLDAHGVKVGRSKKRNFMIKRGLPGFVMPVMKRLERQWGSERPRLFGRRIRDLRRAIRGPMKTPFTYLMTWCRLAEKEPLISEPSGFRPFGRDTEEWKDDWYRIFSAGKIVSAHAVRFALAFHLTGKKKFLELAKRWALHLAGWNPYGPTNLHINDEAGMPILERLSLVYDWLYPHWTDIERERFCQCMLIRGEEAMERDRRVHFAARPFYNHQCRTLAFSGYAGVAFLGDIPQASGWLEHALSILAVSYPSGSWGADDGVWAQGLSYWAAYMSWLIPFVAALHELGLNLNVKPFYRTTGYFPIYHLPLNVSRGGFGDHAEAAAGLTHKVVVGALGAISADPHLCAYAGGIPAHLADPGNHMGRHKGESASREWDAFMLSDVQLLLALPLESKKISLASVLPAAHYSPYTGWVAMHSDLAHPAFDTWVQFKSSPFGSCSHSHADQNSFNLFAYGEPLLIDSGYYPWMGSPHDILWTRQSWAHNLVLIDGHGQPVNDWFARGRIAAFEDNDPVVYARGEAADAYNREPGKGQLDFARKHAPAVVEPMKLQNRVIRASRSVIMVRGDVPWFVVTDWLETEKPAKFQWLAHTLRKMRIKEHGFTVSQGDARLAIKFVVPQRLRFSRNDKFTISPEGRARDLPRQWHLQAETTQRANTCRFVTVLIPYQKGKTPPAVSRIATGSAIGAKIGNDWFMVPREGVAGTIMWDDEKTNAAAVISAGGRIFIAEA